MKVNLRILLGCAAALWLKPVAADDILAMLQNSLRVNQQSEEMDSKNEIAALPDSTTVSKLEEIVMARVREGLRGNSNFTRTINASIKAMFTGMIATTASNQRTLKSDIKAFSKCKNKMWAVYDKTIPIERDFWILGEIYPRCIAAEEALWDKMRVANKIEATTKKELKVARKLLKVAGDRCKNTCSVLAEENYGEQLDRLQEYYGDCKKKLDPLWKKKEALVASYAKALLNKMHGNAKYNLMVDKCKLIAFDMNTKKCQAVHKFRTACGGYGTCWRETLRIYNKDRRWIGRQENEMKTEWRALHRIQCFLLVLDAKDDAENKKQLDICIKIKRSDIDTSPLNIDYLKVPAKPKCPQDPWCPCSSAYMNWYYKKGHKHRCWSNIKTYSCPGCPKGNRRRR